MRDEWGLITVRHFLLRHFLSVHHWGTWILYFLNFRSPMLKQVLICQGKACRKSGSQKVLAAFRAQAVNGIEIVASGCLGRCGNGPMVLVLPEGVWYRQVLLEEVGAICDAIQPGTVP